MIPSQNTPRLSVRYKNRILIISLLLLLLFSACSYQQQEQAVSGSRADPSPPSQDRFEAAQISTFTLPPEDESTFFFEEGRYKRDQACPRSFGYHKTTFEGITIAIADNFLEAQDQQELAKKVVDQYTRLSENSPIPLNQPLTVLIMPDLMDGECYSQDHLVFTTPDALSSKLFVEDLLGVAAGAQEYWIRAGLISLTLGEPPDREVLKNWYQTTDDLNMIGLFFARFLEDWATEEERIMARMTAASLVQYALEVEQIPPNGLDQQINNSVRTRWVEWLGVHRTIDYPYDGRFTGFTYSQSKDCSLVVQTKAIRFCLNRLPDQEYFDEVAEAEFLVDYVTYGHQSLVDFILSEAPSVKSLMNPEETITFEVKELPVALGYTDGNTIRVHRSAVYYYPLHEVVHTFDWNRSFRNNPLWLVEGFAEYLGKLLPFYKQTSKQSIFEEVSSYVTGKDTRDTDYSYWYFLDPDQSEAARKWYLLQGGKLDNEESIDPRLFTDAVAFATMVRDAHGGSMGIPIGVKYENLYPDKRFANHEGWELSYTQSASFIAWLCDTYSIDRVLDVYVNGAEGGKLDGKSYEDLKSIWLDVLRSKGQGIQIPGQP